MVLQRETKLPVWGTAAPGEMVSVEIAGQNKSTTADGTGRWRIDLDPLQTSKEPLNMTVRGSNTLSFADILVGEVWFCSGQSNMEKPLGPMKKQRPTQDHDLEIASARQPLLRLYQIPKTSSPQEGPAVFHWRPCSPEALRESAFSAAAYYFGQKVQQVLDVPVGIIHASFGGTFIDAWMPPEAFETPVLKGMEHRHFQPWVEGIQATQLYKSMVAPHAPFALRGFLWYQGETNLMDGDVALYAEKQKALIASWRKVWELPQAPFFGVLLAPMDYSRWEKFPVTDNAEPAFWEQQIKALSEPGCGYVVTTDLVSDTHDIHPVNKRDVGLRLARLALADCYGRQDIASRGPSFRSMLVNGSVIELTFDHAEGLRARDGAPLNGFSISGPEHSFQPALARIEGDRVLVSSDKVQKPLAVRFAWQETAKPNLINAAGLPAAPFRTDDWALHYLRPISDEDVKSSTR